MESSKKKKIQDPYHILCRAQYWIRVRSTSHQAVNLIDPRTYQIFLTFTSFVSSVVPGLVQDPHCGSVAASFLFLSLYPPLQQGVDPLKIWLLGSSRRNASSGEKRWSVFWNKPREKLVFTVKYSGFPVSL